MFEAFKKWWDGELIEVEIVDVRNRYRECLFEHTVVECPNGTRCYVLGHRGVKGEKFKVNTWELRKFGLLP